MICPNVKLLIAAHENGATRPWSVASTPAQPVWKWLVLDHGSANQTDDVQTRFARPALRARLGRAA